MLPRAPRCVFETSHPVPELALVGPDLTRSFELARAGAPLPMDLRGTGGAARSASVAETAAGSGHPSPVFLDLETTGLSPGPGTLVVIVGLAFFQDDGCVVRQYVLDEPSVEKRLLEAVAADLAAFSTLVTFNGKSFDVPMLLNRGRLHRLPDPLPSDHLDLLHPARRIWSRRLRQSNLGTLEARVLGVIRDGDVAGAEIPPRYHAYVRDKRWDLFEPVVEHNRQDLVSLARLALRVELLLREEYAEARPSPPDLLGVGVLLERTGRFDAARRCYEGALPSRASADRVEALHRLASMSHRADDLSRATDLYDAVTRYHAPQSLVAAVELAKIHEHRTGDLARALGYARRAEELVASLRPVTSATTCAEVRRRVARLERKSRPLG